MWFRGRAQVSAAIAATDGTVVTCYGAAAHVSIIAACLWLVACAEPSVLPPTMPSPLPVDKVGRLAIVCPADHQSQSIDGEPTTVHFQAPVTTGGQPPVTVGCSPDSGSAFGIGSTEVTCHASDVLQQAASCAFRVTIAPPPKLGVTQFLAFGDSITEGYVSPPDDVGRLVRTSAYPFLLEQILASRYVTQDIRVINAGKGGEHVRYASGRFDAELRRHRPDVLLLMEGTNDLYTGYEAGAEQAAATLDGMVANALSAGIGPYIMTIAPWRSAVYAPLVSSFNDRIRSIAARRGVPLVDVHQVLLTGPCDGVQPIPCIGRDDVHPTAQGYQLIAEELARILVARYDVAVPGIAEAALAVAGPVSAQGRGGRGAATAAVGRW